MPVTENMKTDYKLDEPTVPVMDVEKEKELGLDRTTEGLTFLQRRRLQDRLAWKKYWEWRDKESQDTYWWRVRYWAARAIDAPVTWFRENIVDALNDRNRLPYYHRRLDRVPEIDQCGVEDRVCIFEANEQYRLDKMVDAFILWILKDRLERCFIYWGPSHLWQCTKYLEEWEEGDLNFFIKYGEIGSDTDVVDAYMKQKHRLIWERRHPEIMAERKRAVEEHKQAMKEGKFDLRFWTHFGVWNAKQDMLPSNIYGHHWKQDKMPFEGDQPISKDWRYYKKLAQDPEFDKRNYPQWLNEAARKAKLWEDDQKQQKEQMMSGNGGEE